MKMKEALEMGVSVVEQRDKWEFTRRIASRPDFSDLYMDLILDGMSDSQIGCYLAGIELAYILLMAEASREWSKDKSSDGYRRGDGDYQTISDADFTQIVGNICQAYLAYAEYRIVYDEYSSGGLEPGEPIVSDGRMSKFDESIHMSAAAESLFIDGRATDYIRILCGRFDDPDSAAKEFVAKYCWTCGTQPPVV